MNSTVLFVIIITLGMVRTAGRDQKSTIAMRGMAASCGDFTKLGVESVAKAASAEHYLSLRPALHDTWPQASLVTSRTGHVAERSSPAQSNGKESGSDVKLARTNGSGTDRDSGGRTSGGNTEQLQRNGSRAFAAQLSIFGTGGTNKLQGTMNCATGTVSLSGRTWTYPTGAIAAAAAASQEIPIITGLNGNARYDHVLLAESAEFASGSVTATKVSLGRAGSSTNDELLPQTSFMQSSGNAWFAFDRPQPPVIGAANTYTVVLAIRTTGGNVSALTAGSVYYEVCGYSVL